MAEMNASPLVFPCDFAIKVFGVASDQFVSQILTIFHQHLPDLPRSAISERLSKDGKYLALTIDVYIENKAELDAIYCDLTASPYVLMAL